MTHSVFITGASRGLGFEFAKQYAEENWNVYASCRTPKKALKLKKLSEKFPNINILKLNITSRTDIEALKKKFKKIPIDLLINNAAHLNKGRNYLEKLSREDLLKTFDINAVAPLFITRALLSSIKLSQLKTVASISSVISSITENYSDEWNNYEYKTNKAALNMLMSCFANESNHAGIRVLLLDPGWVKTDMGGKGAPITAFESVSGMRSVIQKTKVTRSFITYQGKQNPW